MATTTSSIMRFWSPDSSRSALPANASRMIYLVRTAAELLVFPVTAFAAWELSSNAYASSSVEGRSWMRDSVRDDAVTSRIDIATALAMRHDDPDVLSEAMMPVTLLVKPQQINTLAALTSAELNNIGRFEVFLGTADVDETIDSLQSLQLDSDLLFFEADGAGVIELTLEQLSSLASLGRFPQKPPSESSFSLKLTASNLLDDGALTLIENVADRIPIKTESILEIDIHSSLSSAISSLRTLLDSAPIQKLVVNLETIDQAYLTLATFGAYRSIAEQLEVVINDVKVGLSLMLPGERQLERMLSNPAELMSLVKLGINKMGVIGTPTQEIALNLPEWLLLNMLNLEVESNIQLCIPINSDSDLRGLLSKGVDNDLNQATVIIDDLLDVGLKNTQSLVRKGYHLSSSDANELNTFRLDDGEISLFMSNPSEWVHLFESAGIEVIYFGNSVILTEQATRALLDSPIVLDADQLVAGTLTLNSIPDDFFTHVVEWMNEKKIYSLAFIDSAANADFFSLGTDLDNFSEWALDTSIDLNFKNFEIGIPEYLLQRQQEDWVNAVEANLNIQIVGISDSDIQLIYKGGLSSVT